jgi:hypothetical protein
MFPRHAKLFLRHVSYCFLPAILAFSVTATPAAIAQSSNEFSSSTQLLAAADEDSSNASPAPGAPAPAIGGSQADGAYGSRHSGLVSHLAIEAGGGFNAPTSDSSSYITWGDNVTIGAGYRITPHVSLLSEYQFIDDKLLGRIISDTGANGGNAHIWSFTLAPVIDLFPRRRNDLYVTGGGGFYRKVTNFTDPVAVEYCNFYYCGITTVNQVVGHFSSNQGGWNAGVGVTHRLGDGKTKLFAEVRYLDIDTPGVTSQPNGLGTTTIAANTRLIPVTFGVRW